MSGWVAALLFGGVVSAVYALVQITEQLTKIIARLDVIAERLPPRR